MNISVLVSHCYISPKVRPVARISQQGGPKTKCGATFLNAILDVCSNREAKHEMRGPGTTAPPLAATLPKVMAKFYINASNATVENG